MIKLCVLGSGSKGNATYVEFDGYGILIDAGFSFKELKRRLGLIGKSIKNVKNIFVSHGHNDHIKAVPQIQKKHPDIFVYKDVFSSEITFGKNSIGVKSFLLSHDSFCKGFDFTYKDFKLSYVPDTGCVTQDAAKALLSIKGIENHVIIIECNYDLKMLTDGKYESELMERIFADNGHMDNIESARILKEVWHDKLKLVLPFHLSVENNNPALVEYEIRTAVKQPTRVVCTSQQIPTEVFYFV